MSEFVEMTEWVRFNPDGSSSHIKVIDGVLFDSFEMNPSPYVVVRGCPPDWIVESKKCPKSDILQDHAD